jgi:alanyl-tRNA synthetase
MANEHILVNQLTELLKVPSDRVVDRVEKTIQSLKDAERTLLQHKRDALMANFESIVGTPMELGKVAMWTFMAPEGTDPNGLRELTQRVIKKSSKAAVCIGLSEDSGKINIVVGANESAVEISVSANDVLKTALVDLEGRGGGKADFAQGSGTNSSGVTSAIERVASQLRGV